MNINKKTGEKKESSTDTNLLDKISQKVAIGRFDEAIEDYTRVIENDHNCIVAYLNRAYCYCMLEEYDKSIDDYNQVIILEKNNVIAYTDRGICFEQKGEYDKAIKDYEKLVELTSNKKYYHYIYLCYVNTGRYNDALPIIDKYLEEEPNAVEVIYDKAFCYDSMGKFTEAIKWYTEVVKKDDYVLIAYLNRGICYGHNNMYKEAVDDFTRIIEFINEKKRAIDEHTHENGKDEGSLSEPNTLTVKTYIYRGFSYIRLEKYDEALQDYYNILNIECNNVDAHVNIGCIYLTLGKVKEAIKALENIEDADAYFNLGNCYERLGQHFKSIEQYKKAIEMGSKNIQVYNNLGVVYQILGQHDDAIQNFTKAIEMYYVYSRAYKNRGTSYAKLGKNKEALSDFLRAISIDYVWDGSFSGEFAYYTDIMNKNNDDDIRNSLSCLMMYSKDKEFYNYVKTRVENKKVRRLIGDLFNAVHDLKDSLLYKMPLDNLKIAHYTKASTLKYLFKPDNVVNSDNKIPYLRLNNVAYMNDPTEGTIFLTLLRKSNNEDKINSILMDIYGDDDNDRRQQVLGGNNNVFLASFCEAVDSLPMWIQYSDGGKGCCIIPETLDYFDMYDYRRVAESFDNLRFEDMVTEKKQYSYDFYPLYSVVYCQNKNEQGQYTNQDLKARLRK